MNVERHDNYGVNCNMVVSRVVSKSESHKTDDPKLMGEVFTDDDDVFLNFVSLLLFPVSPAKSAYMASISYVFPR